MERPTNSRIVIEDKGDILIVTVTERDYLQPILYSQKFRWSNLHRGSLLTFVVYCVGFSVLGVFAYGFIMPISTAVLMTVLTAAGFWLIVLLMSAIDAIRSPPLSVSADTSEASVIFYDNSYFTVEGTRWLYHPEMAPNWDIACHLGNDLYAVYIPRQFPPEIEVSKDDQANLWSYEIICRYPEEAQWVLQEIETFLKRFDISAAESITVQE